MSTTLQNSIWPNSGGKLGEIKVAIPDGVTTTWPEGDALVGNFVYNQGKLVGFVDTKALILNDSATTTINYDFVDVTFDSIEEGTLTINRGPRSKYFTVRYGISVEGDGEQGGTVITFKYKGCKTVDDIKAVDADYKNTDIVDGVWSEGLGDLENSQNMFYHCYNLIAFSSDLSSLTNGQNMFGGCTNLTTFTSDLSSLTNGQNMFQFCENLTSFSSDSSGSPVNLSSLTNGQNMFYGCSKLTTFSSDLSSLTDGMYMFGGCNNLTTFTSDLSSLTNGYNMFYHCYNLTAFNADLSSLTDGMYMFEGCKLDTASVQNIADTINTVTRNPQIHIGIGQASSPSSEEETYFQQMRQKGWDVLVQTNGGSTSCATCCASLTTLDENGEETVTPKPYWAKPVPSDEEHAQYVDSEGNFYNILGGDYIYVHNPDEYGMFTSIYDAASNMRLTKIGEEEIETA